MMNKMKMTRGLVEFWLLLTLMPAAGCDGLSNEESGDIPSELVGKWYNKDYILAFEITPAGEGYIAEKRLHCTVSISGHFVYFRYDGNLTGSFYYSINKNGELTMTNGLSYFDAIESASPFVKSSAIPPGGRVPVELIGNWYATRSPSSAPNFIITAAGTMTISGDIAEYTVSIPGNTASVLNGSILKGTFWYEIRYGEMSVYNGTEICAGLSVLSPFVKRRL